MKNETRAYLICFSDLGDYEGDIHDLTDEEWIKKSEEQGLIYTLGGFAAAYNAEWINEVDTVMRFIKTKAKETKC